MSAAEQYDAARSRPKNCTPPPNENVKKITVPKDFCLGRIPFDMDPNMKFKRPQKN